MKYMIYTNQKDNKKGLKVLILGILSLNLIGYAFTKEKAGFLLVIFSVIASVELIILLVSLATIHVNKSEKSILVAIIMLSFDYILGFYIWWIGIADGKAYEYVIMALGILVGGVLGYIFVSNERREKQKSGAILLVLTCSTVAIMFTREIGAFLNQDQIKLLGELVIDVIMMMFSFSIVAGISKIRKTSKMKSTWDGSFHELKCWNGGRFRRVDSGL